MIRSKSNSNILSQGTISPVFIAGLGWLGLPLAKHLQSTGHKVAGTVTTAAKQQQLTEQNITSYCFSLNTFSDIKGFETELRNANVVVNIPPNRKTFDRQQFVESITKFVDAIMNAGAHRLIFVSTTSVYGSQTGIVDHTSLTMPVSGSAKAHCDVENYLLNHYPNNAFILRLSGLIGSNADTTMRHPIFSLVKKDIIANGNDPVNLIHQHDVIATIERLMSYQGAQRIFVLSALEHPSRQEYYTWCAKMLGLPPPQFDKDDVKRKLSKRVDPRLSLEELGLELRYSSPYQMLSQKSS